MQQRGTVTIIEGNIGAGKSTFAQALGKALGPDTLVVMEPDEQDGQNPYLADFYQDKARWATLLQLHQLHKRFGAQKMAMNRATVTGNHAVLDRSYYGDTCFARMLYLDGIMPEREFESYEMAYHTMSEGVNFPNVCVRLMVSPETCLERIKGRYEAREGRKCESSISLDYLARLDREIGFTCNTLKDCGVRLINLPYDASATPAQIACQAEAMAKKNNRNQDTQHR